VFIDPDGDTHNYYEQEINALGAEWDLMLNRPYRDRGNADCKWEIRGLKINMHAPESRGFLQFSDQRAGVDAFQMNPDEKVKGFLREVYLAQRAYHAEQGRYAATIGVLKLRPEIAGWDGTWLRMTAPATKYQITLSGTTCKTWQIRQDGWIGCE
jgi:hypothetical protein